MKKGTIATDGSLARAEEIDRMAMEIMAKPEPKISDLAISKAKKTIEALEEIVGEKFNVVVVDGGEGIPQISMVRPYAKAWFTPEQVKSWNDAMRRRAPASWRDSIPMRTLVKPNPPTYDVEVTVQPISRAALEEKSSSSDPVE